MELFRHYLKTTILTHNEIDRMITEITQQIVNSMDQVMLTIDNINTMNARVAEAVGEQLGDIMDPSLRFEIMVTINNKGHIRVMWAVMDKNNENVGLERLIP